jgi:DNA invertase Pin-like site-specific DNA recombinase
MAPYQSTQPKLYSYLRFSTPAQAEGDSARRQMRLAEDEAAKRGLVVDETLRDEGISSYRAQNLSLGKLGKFLEAVRNGWVAPGSVLLVESFDRISRQQAWRGQGVITELLGSGITLVTLSGGVREFSEAEMDQNPLAIFEILLTLMRAHDESATKADRVRQAWDAKRQDALKTPGAVLTKRCPAWIEYDEETETFRLIPERAAIVRRIFEDAALGHGQAGLAKALNAEGVETWGDTGRKPAKHWHRSYVAKILENPAAMGTYVPHTQTYKAGRKIREPQEPIPGYFPAAVPEGLYQSVQALRPNPRRGRNASKEVRNVFGGLLLCGVCGGTATRVFKGNRRGHGEYLVCRAAKEGAGCDYRTVPYNTAERALRTNADRLLSDPPSGDESLSTELENVEALLFAGQDHVEHILDEIQAGNTSSSLRERLEEIERKLDALKDQREKLRALQAKAGQPMIAHRVKQLQEAFMAEEFDRTKVNALLRQTFRAITLDRAQAVLRFEWQQGGQSEIQYAFPTTEEEPV